MNNTLYTERSAELRTLNDALAASQPGQRARNLAQALGVSEAQWVAAQCNGVRATALTRAGSPQEIFRELGTLGEVMALTRNAWCVRSEEHTSELQSLMRISYAVFCLKKKKKKIKKKTDTRKTQI